MNTVAVRGEGKGSAGGVRVLQRTVNRTFRGSSRCKNGGGQREGGSRGDGVRQGFVRTPLLGRLSSRAAFPSKRRRCAPIFLSNIDRLGMWEAGGGGMLSRDTNKHDL